MFGLSFGKILFTLLVIAAVWRGFRWVQDLQQRRAERALRRRPQARRTVSLELEPCPGCGTYLPRGSSCHSCGPLGAGAKPPRSA